MSENEEEKAIVGEDGEIYISKEIVEEYEANSINPEDVVEDDIVFTAEMERRMLTAKVIKVLFAEKKPDMTWQEAYDAAGEPENVVALINILSDHQNQIGAKLDEVDAPEDVIAAAKKIFWDKRDG